MAYGVDTGDNSLWSWYPLVILYIKVKYVQYFAPLAARLLRWGPETGIAPFLDFKTLINFPLYVTAQEMRNITCLF